MKALSQAVKRFFTKEKTNDKKVISKFYFEGLNAFKEGNSKFINKIYEEALVLYDTAILYDVEEAYEQRALCLQALNFHLDALDDFEHAIAYSPQDCNIYYCRCWSQAAVGRNEEALADIEKAFWLSKSQSISNDYYNQSARLQGYASMTALIEMQRKAISTIAKFSEHMPVKSENLIRRTK